MTRAFLSPDEIEEAIDVFVNNRTGITAHAIELLKPAGHPDICVYSTDVSNVTNLLDNVVIPARASSLGGAGSSTSRRVARVKAYCEALERYSNVVYDSQQVVIASRDELGDEAVDLNLFAQGSAAEYSVSHPRNIFRAPDSSRPMRWVKGHSLISGQPQYVPFMAVYISSPFEYPAEAFLTPISTGSALAASYEQAIISGLAEVVERDALMITWLQQLALPRIDISDIDDPAFLDRLQRTEQAGIQQIFFDATLDTGIPTIYALQINPDASVASIVMASTKLDPLAAMIRVMDEAAPSRLAISHWTHRSPSFSPDDFRTFNGLEDGAVYYADATRLNAFDFLLNHDRTRPFSAIENIDQGSVDANLTHLINICRRHDLDVLVVDMTPGILREVGLYVVKVIVPQMIPLAINYNLRYTAAPRLYDVPAKLGYPVRSVDDLNPNPQPFA